MTNSELTARLIMDIINGKYSANEVDSIIKRYESQDTMFFANYEIKKKDKPWDFEYLNELKTAAMTGLASKQFIIHLAEVSEYVHEQERIRKSKEKGKKCIIIAAIATMVITIIILILCMNKVNAAELPHETDSTIIESSYIYDSEYQFDYEMEDIIWESLQI